MAKVVGIDIGGQKIMMVGDDGEIIRTDTGSIAWNNLIAFHGKNRLIGEEALPQVTGDNTVMMINNFIGKTPADAQSSSIIQHLRCKLSSSKESSSVASFDISYCDEIVSISATSLLSMIISKLYARIVEISVSGATPKLVFTVPPSTSLSTKKAIFQACEIAGIDLNNVSTIESSECLVKTYGRKILGSRDSEKVSIQGKKSIIIDMGHTQTTVVIVEVSPDGPIPLAVTSDLSLGAVYFDMQLFDHFSNICASKSGSKVVPGSKRGARLLSSCERIRKLLSQLPDAQVTVENLTDNGDMGFSLRREELSTLCSEQLTRFKNLIVQALEKAQLPPDMISNVEVLGGGTRMQVVQAAIIEVLGEGLPLGAKLDDVSIPLGGALLTIQSLNNAERASNPPTLVPPVNSEPDTGSPMDTDGSEPTSATPPSTEAAAEDAPMDVDSQVAPTQAVLIGATSSSLEGVGDVLALTREEVDVEHKKELAMRARDAEIRALQAARNDMEAYILEMRGASRRKHGELVDSSALSTTLDSYEGWLWDQSDNASLQELLDQNSKLREEVQKICAGYFQAVEADRLAVEKQLEEEAKKAEAERAAEGDDEDHDNRKLKKADRMRLVVKNKEEGNELFRGKNFRPAAARYHKALSHIAKFFDLSPEDEKEVNQLKLTLYLNLAQCYISLENWDQALRNCDDALTIDTSNAKALFRRSAVWEAKKDFEKALLDLKTAEKIATEDKMISKSIERVKKAIQKEKDKEKKTWGNVFAKA